jgi:hypothetical protein
MRLTLLQSTQPIQYELCLPGDGVIYNSYLCTPPRQYREEFFSSGIKGFYYDANKDEYVLIVLMQFAAWPSWRVNVWHINPETGLSTSKEEGVPIPNIFFVRSYENGQLKKVYANKFAGAGSNSILVVDPVTYAVNTNFPVVVDADVGGFLMDKFLLSRTNNLVALSDVSKLRRYNYATQTQLESISFPEWTANDLAYESESVGWGVLSSATGFDAGLSVIKFNYLDPAVEILTAIQSNGTERDSSIAFDSKRKAIAVFRNMPVDTDGASLDILDIYKPVPGPFLITEAVPQGKLIPGKTVQMIAHIIGDRGEAGTVQCVTVSNTGSGTILQTVVAPRGNGTISFQYRAGPNPGTDTITLTAEI